MQVAMGTKTLLPWAEESMGEICQPNPIKSTKGVSPGQKLAPCFSTACLCPAVVPSPLLPAVKLNSNLLLQTGCLKILHIPKALGVMDDKQTPI